MKPTADDPFLAEAKSHAEQAARYGAVAFRAFIAAIASFTIYAWRVDDGWCWWFWWAAVFFLLRMSFAIQERWFHRQAARIAIAFHAGIYQ
jgi:hypothetical protein